MEYLSTKFSSLFSPGENLAVDEAMIKFQGRSTLIQYMPMKPIKRGLRYGCWLMKIDSFPALKFIQGKKMVWNIPWELEL